MHIANVDRRLRDPIGCAPPGPRPKAGHGGVEASAQPSLPGMEAC
jgi:hypothetical protein